MKIIENRSCVLKEDPEYANHIEHRCIAFLDALESPKGCGCYSWYAGNGKWYLRLEANKRYMMTEDAVNEEVGAVSKHLKETK